MNFFPEYMTGAYVPTGVCPGDLHNVKAKRLRANTEALIGSSSSAICKQFDLCVSPCLPHSQEHPEVQWPWHWTEAWSRHRGRVLETSRQEDVAVWFLLEQDWFKAEASGYLCLRVTKLQDYTSLPHSIDLQARSSMHDQVSGSVHRAHSRTTMSMQALNAGLEMAPFSSIQNMRDSPRLKGWGKHDGA